MPHKAVPEISKIVGNLQKRLAVANREWHGESTDGLKGDWNCIFGLVAMVAVVTSPTSAGCSVAKCNCNCSVV